MDENGMGPDLETRFAGLTNRLPAGSAAVTIRGSADAESLTLAADSLTVLSSEPPLLAVSVDSGAPVTEIPESARFTVQFGEGGAGRFECALENTVPAGDHRLLIGRVEAMEDPEPGGHRPLLFNRSGSSLLVGHLPSKVPLVDISPGGAPPKVAREAPSEPVATIAIVGGGASGTLTAVQLLRRSAPGLRVVLVEKSERVGPGVAYGTEDEQHRLNVPAGQMIGLPDRPYDFLEWVRREAPETQPQEYLARRVFGRYLVDLLDRTIRESAGVAFERIRAEAIGIDAGEPGGLVTLELDDGREVRADRVVLALGNGRPSELPGIDPALAASERYVADPWSPGAIEQALTDEAVLLIGTGLTTVDMAISLGGPGGPEMQAVSRHGLLPRAHGDTMPVRGRPVALPDDRCSLTELTSRLLTEIAVAGARGEDWRVAFDSLRPITNDLWRSLDRRDQKRFLSDLSRIWGVHRHRMAPRVALRLERLKVNRRLRVRAASIIRAELEEERVAVQLRMSNSETEERLLVDRVINCTGPTWDPRRLDQPLVGRLLEGGLLRADALGIGFDVDDDGALIGSDAVTSERIFAIGPPRNGVLLETTAVPEIGQQAELLADLLLSGLARTLGRARELSVA
ncbi:MAG: FAD/NAD(P)-binding protein [Solirubrobacterales bacterium]|nr:FAD/NAD(P)-binding protein [Solirubrobacterales bacterium]